MRDQETISQTKVPILGDIPILGALFRQHKTTKAKTNLLLILTPYVVRDQDDLRAIFERKMQERQEFLDRYFVFNEDSAWEPPRDFSRANGLVETIRQTMMDELERERLIQESSPRAPKLHVPVEPISMPTVSSSGGSSSSSSSSTTTTNPSTTAKPATTTSKAPRGTIKPGTIPSPLPKTDRVE